MDNTITGKPADEFSLWSARLRIPTGWKQTSWLFTRVTEGTTQRDHPAIRTGFEFTASGLQFQ